MAGIAPATKLSGQEVPNGYAEITSNFTTASSSLVDVTGATLTCDPLAAVCTIESSGSQIQSTVAGVAQISIMEGATQIHTTAPGITVAANPGRVTPALLRRRTTPTAGSHTYKLQAAMATGGGTLTISAAATQPHWIQVIWR